jgi:hypothetical protein
MDFVSYPVLVRFVRGVIGTGKPLESIVLGERLRPIMTDLDSGFERSCERPWRRCSAGLGIKAP